MFELPEWLKRCRFYFMRVLSDDSENLSGWHDAREEHQVSGPENANLIGSQFVEGRRPLHKVFIDLDVEHWYVPSSTEGHGHLYINVDLEPDELSTLMGTLVKFGIVGEGWAYQLKGRGENTFRLPGWNKTPQEIQDDKWTAESEERFKYAPTESELIKQYAKLQPISSPGFLDEPPF